jgi:hypothetical protein
MRKAFHSDAPTVNKSRRRRGEERRPINNQQTNIEICAQISILVCRVLFGLPPAYVFSFARPITPQDAEAKAPCVPFIIQPLFSFVAETSTLHSLGLGLRNLASVQQLVHPPTSPKVLTSDYLGQNAL